MMDSIIREDLETIAKSVPTDLFEGRSVLVSGGSGFLGSWVCDVLMIAGARVHCLDNLSTGLFENIDHLKGKRGFEFERADVSSYVGKGKFDLIFHLASRPSPEDYQKHPVETALANSAGTHRMLEVARKDDARVFFASSSEVYGDPEVFPTPESYEGKVDSLGPRSCYEEGKRFGETLCKAYQDEYGIDARIGRIFNSYGPRLRAEGSYGRVVSRFLLQSLREENLTVFGDGSQTRAFCYVADTVVGVLCLTSTDKLDGGVVNIGSQEETKIIDLAARVSELSASKRRIDFLPFPPGDHKRRLPDVGRAEKLLGWNPRVKLETGLERTRKWWHLRNLS